MALKLFLLISTYTVTGKLKYCLIGKIVQQKVGQKVEAIALNKLGIDHFLYFFFKPLQFIVMS